MRGEIGKCDHCKKEKPLYGYDYFYARLCYECWLKRNASAPKKKEQTSG